jgi:hypothetical protein
VLKRFLFISFFFAVACPPRLAPGAPAPQAGITFFRTDVIVREDTLVEVREEIAVKNASAFYPRGFLRHLPLSYDDRWVPAGDRVSKGYNDVRLDILEVSEDGRPVSYEQGRGFGYSQLSIGTRNVPLDSGEHRFVIRYVADSAVDTRAGRDLLYWNAPGRQREAPASVVIFAIHFPAKVPAERIEVAPRFGGQGLSLPSRPDNAFGRVDDPSGAIVYRAMNVGPKQSLTLRVTWPSGYIHDSPLDVLRRDRWMLAAPTLLFFYYLIAWFSIGPDPKPGAVVARYEPPEGLSPASARYIASGATDGRSFAAVIAQLAVRKCVRVEIVNGKFRLSRLMTDRASVASLAPEEKRIFTMLFEDGPVMEINPAMDERANAQNSRYITKLHQELAKQLGNKYFTPHTDIILFGVLFTFLAAMPMALAARGRDTTGVFMFTFWVLFCGLVIGIVIERAFLKSWKTVWRARAGWTRMIPLTEAVVVFVGIVGFFLNKLAAAISISFAVMLVGFLLINLGWAPLLKRKTKLGSAAADQIAGFRLFLEKVEQDQLDRLHPRSDAPQNLDELIPYAIALEVKEAWGDYLAQSFLSTTVYTEG